MKVIILAGGLGTRISEETNDKPKPMVLIDGKPILWHLMNIFAQQGLTDFIVATGYKGEVINNWLEKENFSWNIKALDTGIRTQTGGRIKRCMKELSGERVLVTYGDGLANVDLNKLISFHEKQGKKATITAVRPPARFGHLEIEDDIVINFGEKNQSDAGWINGGFIILEPQVELIIKNDEEIFEFGALPALVFEGELAAYRHTGFWQPMDTLREKNELARYAKLSPPPWLQF